jgi:hypothetical protein
MYLHLLYAYMTFTGTPLPLPVIQHSTAMEHAYGSVGQVLHSVNTSSIIPESEYRH